MILPPAPQAYDRANEQRVREAVSRADTENLKREVAAPYLLLTDEDTGETGKLTVNSGVINWTAL